MGGIGYSSRSECAGQSSERFTPGRSTDSMDFIEDVLKATGHWAGAVLAVYRGNNNRSFDDWRRLFISVLVLFILVALVSNLMSALKNEGAAKAAKDVFIVCQLVVLINAFHEVLGIVEEAMTRMIEFLKLMIPAYMICIAAAGSGLTALIFTSCSWFLCLIEGIVAASTDDGGRGYVMLGVVESVWGEERFKGLIELIKKGLQWVLKMMIVVMSGSSILQVIITPVVDKTNNAVIQKNSRCYSGNRRCHRIRVQCDTGFGYRGQEQSGRIDSGGINSAHRSTGHQILYDTSHYPRERRTGQYLRRETDDEVCGVYIRGRIYAASDFNYSHDVIFVTIAAVTNATS